MTTRAILHVGMHKTGSSYLQNTLHSNRDRLADVGILYPDAGLHLDSPQAGYRHLGLRRSLAQEGPECFAMRSLRDEIASGDFHTVIVSYEGFFTPDTDAADLRSAFEEFDPTLMLVLRHPVDYIESKYREWVRLLNDTRDIDRFLDWQWPFLDVVDRADEWAAEFGAERLYIRSYDGLAQPSGIIEALFDLVPGPAPELEPSAQSNPGPSNEYTLAKLLANRLRLSGVPTGDRAARALDSDDGHQGRLLSDADIAELEERAVPQFRSLLERYGENPDLRSLRAEEPRDEQFFDADHRRAVLDRLRAERATHQTRTEERAREQHRRVVEAKRNVERLQAARERLGRKTERINRLEDQLTDTRAQLTRTQALAEETQHSLDDTKAQLTQALDRLQAVQARLQETTAERASLRRRLDLLQFWRPRSWAAYTGALSASVRRLTRRRS